MRGVANNFLKIIDASETLSEELKVVVMNIDDPGRLADLIATNLDIEVAEKQEILEETSPAQAPADPVQDRHARTGRAGAGAEAADPGAQVHRQGPARVLPAPAAQGHPARAGRRRRGLGRTGRTARADRRGRSAREGAGRRRARVRPPRPHVARGQRVHRQQDLPGLAAGSALELVSSEDKLDLKRAEEILERDHYGLEDVKERIIEYLAVRKLKDDHRGPDPLPGRASGRGQDLPGPQHRRGRGPQVLPLLPGRHARRGGDPRPPAHLRGLHARPHHRTASRNAAPTTR